MRKYIKAQMIKVKILRYYPNFLLDDFSLRPIAGKEKMPSQPTDSLIQKRTVYSFNGGKYHTLAGARVYCDFRNGDNKF